MCGRYPCRSIIHSICPYVRPLLYTNKCRIARYKSKGVGGWGKEPEPLTPLTSQIEMRGRVGGCMLLRLLERS